MTSPQFPASFKPIQNQNDSQPNFPSSFKPIQNKQASEEIKNEPKKSTGAVDEFIREVIPAARKSLGFDTFKKLYDKLPDSFKNQFKGENKLIQEPEEILPLDSKDKTYLTHLAGKLGKELPDIIAALAQFKILPSRIGPPKPTSPRGKVEILPKEPPPSPKDTIEELFAGQPKETRFETAERVLKETQQNPSVEKPLGTSRVPSPPTKASSLSGRVSAPEGVKPEKIPSLQISVPVKQEVSEFKPERISKVPQLGDYISKDRFVSDASAGTQQEKAVKQVSSEERKPVEKAYEAARKVTAGSVDVYPDLLPKVENIISELEKVEKRNSGQETVYQQAKAIESLISSEGSLKEESADRLIAQSDSMSKLINYEFPYTGYKNILKRLVRDTNESVIESLKRQGKNYRTVQIADEKYAKWADKFLGDEIAPFLDKKILDPEALYSKSVRSPGTYRALEQAIGKKNPALMEKLDRSLVEDRLGKYWSNPEKIGTEEFNKALRDIKELIGQERTERAFEALNRRKSQHEIVKKVKERGESSSAANKQQATPLKGRISTERQKVPRPMVSPEQAPRAPTKGKIESLLSRVSKATSNKAAKIKNMTPSQILDLMKKPEGLRDLKKSLPDNLYKDLTDQELRSILRERKIEKDLTSEEIYNLLNKEDIFQIFTEILGKEEVSALLQTSKYLSQKQASKKLTEDLISKLIKDGVITAAKGKLALKALKYIFKYLI